MSEPNVVGNPQDWKTIHEFVQWKIQVHKNDEHWRIVNLGERGEEKFYIIAPKGAYGTPHKFKDPQLALPIPPNCRYVDGKGEQISPDQSIGGVIVKDGNGQVVARLSLSNPEKREDNWVIGDNGELTYKGQTYHLRTLYMENKHEVTNYIAYFWLTPREDGTVKVLEPEDLPL